MHNDGTIVENRITRELFERIVPHLCWTQQTTVIGGVGRCGEGGRALCAALLPEMTVAVPTDTHEVIRLCGC